MDPVAFSLGSFNIYWYSIFIIFGVLIASYMILREGKRFGIRKDFLINLMFWTILIGIVGARLYFVVFNWDYYSINPGEIFNVRGGGLAIHGGIIFGALTMLLYCKKYKVKSARIFDLIVPALLLAQAIGRWGNFFNGEAFGPVVSQLELQKLLIIPDFIINGMLINGAYRLPMFYFEFLWCMIGVIILLFIRRTRYLKVGMLAGMYLAWYSLGRFFIESFRTDSLMWGSMKAAQIISIALFVIGIIIVLIQSRKPKLDELYNKREEVEEIRF